MSFPASASASLSIVRTLTSAVLALFLGLSTACSRSHEPVRDYRGAWLSEDGTTLLRVAPDLRVWFYAVDEVGGCLVIAQGILRGDAIIAMDGTRYPVAMPKADVLVVFDQADGLLDGRYASVDFDEICDLEPPPGGENGDHAFHLPVGPVKISNRIATREVVLEVPQGTIAFAIYVFGKKVGDSVWPSALEAPNGQNLLAHMPDLGFCSPGFCSIFVPRNAALGAVPGRFALTMRGPEPDLADLDARGVLRAGPSLSLTRIALKPIVATSQLTAEDLDVILERARLVYEENADVVLDVLPPESAESRFALVPGDFSHPSVVELSRAGEADAVNVYFVDRVTGIAGILGLASGIPSSLGVRGPWNGVLVALDTHRLGQAPFDLEMVGDTVLHEVGHALGLFHTTEEDGRLHDPIADTPECPPSNDVNGDGILTVDECELLDGYNFLFWTPMYGDAFLAVQHEISSEQAMVLSHVVIGGAP